MENETSTRHTAKNFAEFIYDQAASLYRQPNLNHEAAQEDARADAHAFLRQMTAQLMDGCSNMSCTNAHCFTGRKNGSAGPVRKLTPDSALNIALALLPRRTDGSLECRPFDAHRLVSEDHDARRDHTSLSQHLSRTKVMKDFLMPGKLLEQPRTIDKNRQMLQLVFQRLQDLKRAPLGPDGSNVMGFIGNTDAACTILSTIWLVQQHLIPEEHPMEMSLSNKESGKPGQSDSVFVIRQVCEIVAHRLRLDDAMNRHGSRGKPLAKLVQEGIMLMQEHDHRNGFSVHYYSFLRDIFLIAFLRTWDGSFVLSKSCSAYAALWLQRLFLGKSDLQPRFLIESPLWHLDIITAADSWLKYNRDTSIHVLRFRELHDPSKLRDCFVMINHMRMRRSSATNSILDGLRHEFMPPSTRQDIARIQRLERLQESFLVLRIRRSHVLEDAVDQLDGVHQSELLRPLRVRLVEMDGSAIAQDLGGVQIEFFNLLIEALMDERHGLFAKRSNGLFYPRPGCLQPVSFWHKVGTLFGLALYNCIPLPVDLPEAFYRYLQSTWNEDGATIDDAWQEESTSFAAMRNNDIEGWGLTYEFNFEANGIHLVLSVAAHEAFLKGDLTIPVAAITCIDDPSETIDVESIDWPGWRFIMQDELTYRPETVTEHNKHEFIDAYGRMHTYWLIRPQMDALMNGFFEVIDREAARLPDMSSVFAGSKTIDLATIRENTVWEGLLDESNNKNIAELFWSVLSEWPAARVQALVKFVTAIERVPSGAGLTWKISVIESDESNSRLPTSSTCFSTLYLPKYSSAEILDEKLTKAVEMGEYGFFVG